MLTFLFPRDYFPSVLKWKIHLLPSLEAVVPRENIAQKNF